jgi:hypothetical protein
MTAAARLMRLRATVTPVGPPELIPAMDTFTDTASGSGASKVAARLLTANARKATTPSVVAITNILDTDIAPHKPGGERTLAANPNTARAVIARAARAATPLKTLLANIDAFSSRLDPARNCAELTGQGHPIAARRQDEKPMVRR